MGDWVTARSFLDFVPFSGLLVPIFACRLVSQTTCFHVISTDFTWFGETFFDKEELNEDNDNNF